MSGVVALFEFAVFLESLWAPIAVFLEPLLLALAGWLGFFGGLSW